MIWWATSITFSVIYSVYKLLTLYSFSQQEISVYYFSSSKDVTHEMQSATLTFFQQLTRCSSGSTSIVSKIILNVCLIQYNLTTWMFPWSIGCSSAVAFWGRNVTLFYGWIIYRLRRWPRALYKTKSALKLRSTCFTYFSTSGTKRFLNQSVTNEAITHDFWFRVPENG